MSYEIESFYIGMIKSYYCCIFRCVMQRGVIDAYGLRKIFLLNIYKYI
jgi:hypothetical protein